MLDALLVRLADSPTLAVKRGQWRALLAKVYGSDIADDALFVRHTFLNQFAKLLAYAALTDGAPRGDTLLLDIITGEAFHRFGVSNLGEIDFFAWILDPLVRSDVTAMLRRLADSLRVYDLSQINEDLLKQLYQDLVDPETRHELGEFYTPDWLAELTLEEIGYRPGQSLMDPSCGAGTFLFLAIRRLAAQGLTGWALVDFALENVVGMDVHPLAVTISRTNYLLAISPHMQGSQRGGDVRLSPIPVYLADTLAVTEMVGPNLETLIVPVDRDRNEAFYIPADVARSPVAFTSLIEQMEEYARYSPDDLGQNATSGFLRLVRERFGAAQSGIADLSQTYWAANLRLLNRLIAEGRNSIWGYLLKNTARPLLLAAQPFDVIAGNPPWLAYRYIKDKTYQAEVKKLTFGYGLLGGGDVKLFTTMDLSTLFMVHCEGAVPAARWRHRVRDAAQRADGRTATPGVPGSRADARARFAGRDAALQHRDMRVDPPGGRPARRSNTHDALRRRAAGSSDDPCRRPVLSRCQEDDHAVDRQRGCGQPLLLRAIPAGRNAYAA